MPPKKKTPARRTTKKASKPAPAPLPTPGPGERLWVLDEVPFRTLLPGASYDRARKINYIVAPQLPPLLAPYRAKDYSMARWIEDDLNAQMAPTQPGTRMTPRADQLADIATIVTADAAGVRGFLLTSQTGTGKTLVSVRAARKIATRRSKGNRPGNILVLANRPASLCIPDYRRTIHSAGGTEHRWLVTTVDRVHKAAAMGIDWDLIIVDESHNYRAVDSRRSKARAKLTKAGNARHSAVPFVLDMTATPAHDPTEVTYLGPLLAQRTNTAPSTWKGEDFIEALKGQGLHIPSGRYGPAWTEDGAERIADLAWLRNTLEREPAATAYRAAPWGPAPLEVAAFELDPARQAQYESDWQEYIETMALARKVGKSDKGRAALMRQRQKALHLRIPDIAEWAKAQLEAENQVVIYTDFVAVGAQPLADMLADSKIGVAHLYGGQDRDLAGELQAFASGRAPIAVTTMTASINLHAGAIGPDGKSATTTPRVGAMAAPIYSGILGRQVIGRTHRDHQVSPWAVMTTAHTVEERIASVMVGRFAASDSMAGADTAALKDVATLLGADWLPAEALSAGE